MADNSSNLSAVKCACETCQCMVLPGKAVVKNGKVFCSQTCAYDCTETTCVCVHERCGDKR